MANTSSAAKKPKDAASTSAQKVRFIPGADVYYVAPQGEATVFDDGDLMFARLAGGIGVGSAATPLPATDADAFVRAFGLRRAVDLAVATAAQLSGGRATLDLAVESDDDDDSPEFELVIRVLWPQADKATLMSWQDGFMQEIVAKTTPAERAKIVILQSAA